MWQYSSGKQLQFLASKNKNLERMSAQVLFFEK